MLRADGFRLVDCHPSGAKAESPAAHAEDHASQSQVRLHAAISSEARMNTAQALLEKHRPELRSNRPRRHALLDWTVQRAELVAVGVAQIRQIELAGSAFTPSRWVFAGGAAIGNARRMKGIGLLR